MILIIGATGTNGREIAQALAQLGHSVRALVRNKTKAASLVGPNLTLVEGDLDKPESLDAALMGVEKAFLLTAVDERMKSWNHNFIEAAKRSNLKHLVKFSAMGADVTSSVALSRMHGENDEELKRSGISFTILQPNSFFQNMLWSADSIKNQGVFYLPVKQARQSLVDVRDICTVAVRTLTESTHEGRTYLITGPEALTYSEVAAKFSKALGKPVQYVDVPPEAARQGMLKSGMPAWNAETLTDLYGYFASGGAAEVSNAIVKITGKAPRTFDQFLADYLEAFK